MATSAITSNPILPAGKVNVPYSFTFTGTTTTGSPDLVWQIFGSPPPGLVFSDGVLLGTPTGGGTYSFQVILSPINDTNSSEICTISIDSQLSLVNPLSPEGYVGQTWRFGFAQGGATPYRWAVTEGAFPPGLTLNPDGTASGVYTTQGIYTFALTVTDADGLSLRIPVTQTVTGSFPQLTGNVPSIRPGLSYLFTLLMTGGVPPYRFLTTSFCGMSLSSGGVVQGEAGDCGGYMPFVFSDATGTITDTSVNLSSAPPSTASFSGTVISAQTDQPLVIYLPAPNGNPPFTWSGGMPSGLQLDSTDGVLQGQIDTPSTVPFSVTVTDGAGNEQTTAYTLNVTANPLTILNSSLDPVVIGQTGSVKVQLSGASGSPFISLTAANDYGLLFNSTALAADGPIQFNVPTDLAPGTYQVTILAIDGAGAQAQKTLSMVVFSAGLHLGDLTVSNLAATGSYPQRLQVFGGTPPYQVTVPFPSDLPPGLTIDTLGNVSGIPYLAGVYNFAVTASDAGGNSAYRTYSMSIGPPPPLLIALPSALAGRPYSASILTSSAPSGPYTWTFNGPTPPGLILDADGTLHGLPVGQGEYTFDVTGNASNGESDTILEDFVIGPNPALPERTLPDATIGQPYMQQLNSSLTGALQWTVNAASLPAGILFDPSTGQLSGVPGAAGQWGIAATASSNSGTDSAVYDFYSVSSSGLTVGPPAITLFAGKGILLRLTAQGGVPPYTFSPDPSDPASLSPDGLLDVEAPFPFTVYVTDSEGRTGSRTYTPVVDPGPRMNVPDTPIHAQAGVPFSYPLPITGAAAPVSYSAVNAPGLLVRNGVLTGIPQQPGTYSLEISFQYGPYQLENLFYLPLIVDPQPLAVGASALWNAHPGFAYTAPLTAAGGTAPYSWSASSLPQGLALLTTGVLTGVPTQQGLFTIPVIVQDTNGLSASASLSLLIDNSVPAIAPGGVANAGSYANTSVSPGEIVAIFGVNLGDSSLTMNAPHNGIFPNQAAETQILFDGIPAPLIYAQNAQAAAAVPLSLAGKQVVAVTAVRNGVASAPAMINISAGTPGILTANGSGSGQAAALNQDLTVNSESNPASSGSIVVLYITGTGLTFPAVADGVLAPASPLASSVIAVGAVIGGEPGNVLYAGDAPGEINGLTQVNVQLPSSLHSGQLPVVITQVVQGAVVSSQSNATIWVR